MLFKVDNSKLRDGILQPLVGWIYAGADHLVRNARFQLALPSTTAPPIEALLAEPERSLASAARLLLALERAGATRFIPKVRANLEEIAETVTDIAA
jgi:hypothetical protein